MQQDNQLVIPTAMGDATDADDVLQWLDDAGNIIGHGGAAPPKPQRQHKKRSRTEPSNTIIGKPIVERSDEDRQAERVARANAVVQFELDSWRSGYQPPFDPITHQYRITDGSTPRVVERPRAHVLKILDRRTKRALDDAEKNVQRMHTICALLTDRVCWTDADAVAYARLDARVRALQQAGFVSADHNWSRVLSGAELDLHYRHEAAVALSREYSQLAQRNTALATQCDHFDAVRQSMVK